ncbi:phosphatase 2C 56 [Gracilariopsis chorda]|uniref:Phosphatase 2C 56 n=1 Tax=Gracilariopsis chorda TaxID=448386 RepID=A0A2V3ILM6_9FLOR|nr:phosphatase 2C 56 [Gracilariopsis chorda]|eukprot:PXF42992.1 phosphatase 2C 56 [Gracilariopsis chorda]
MADNKPFMGKFDKSPSHHEPPSHKETAYRRALSTQSQAREGTHEKQHNSKRRVIRPPNLKLPPGPSAPATIPLQTKSCSELQAAGDIYAVISKKGPRHRTLEDRFAVQDVAQKGLRPLVSLFGVFDGHGGVEASELASERIFGFVLKAYGKHGDIREALRSAFLKMDEAISRQYDISVGIATERSRKTSSMSDHPLPRTDIPIPFQDLNGLCGTTATVVALIEKTMTVAYVGDSRVIAFGEKEVKRLSEDHRASHSAEQKRCKGQGGCFFNGRINGVLSLTRSIGDADQRKLVIAEPDFFEVQLNGLFDAVVIASDGVWDVLTDEEVAAIAKGSIEDGEQVAARRILDIAIAKNTRDDVSAMVLNLRKYDRRLGKLSLESVATPLSTTFSPASISNSLSTLSPSTPSPEVQSAEPPMELLSPSPLPTPMSNRRNVWSVTPMKRRGKGGRKR